MTTPMFNMLSYVLIFLIGMALGLLGHVSEEGPITARTIISETGAGGTLGLIIYLVFMAICPNYPTVVYALSMFVSYTRWAILRPICNAFLRCVHTIIYTMLNGRLK